jgi:hypothetical protein
MNVTVDDARQISGEWVSQWVAASEPAPAAA